MASAEIRQPSNRISPSGCGALITCAPANSSPSRIGRHHKAGNTGRAGPRIGRREHDIEIRDSRVRDESLAAVDPVATRIARRRRVRRPRVRCRTLPRRNSRHRRHIRPSLPLGHRERTHRLARHRARHPAAGVLAANQPGRRTQPLQREDRVRQRRPPPQHLARDHAAAHIPLGDRTEQSRAPHKPDQLPCPHPRLAVAVQGRAPPRSPRGRTPPPAPDTPGATDPRMLPPHPARARPRQTKRGLRFSTNAW